MHVTDTGIGIPADRLGDIFEPFVQVDARHSREGEGTGLGLAISRDLARGMGGDLTATSGAAGGAAFTLTLRRTVTATGEPVDRRSREERRDGAERRVVLERRGREGA